MVPLQSLWHILAWLPCWYKHIRGRSPLQDQAAAYKVLLSQLLSLAQEAIALQAAAGGPLNNEWQT